MKRILKSLVQILFVAAPLRNAQSATLRAGDAAPPFVLKTHENKDFDIKSRAGQWTVLFFYPKANTPGCTKQACGFRDNIAKIRDQGAEVFGISTDSVEAQAAFHKDQRLNFVLLADSDSKVSSLYGTKMPLLPVSKRWTFVIDPELKVRAIEKNVDPVLDAARVAAKIAELKDQKN